MGYYFRGFLRTPADSPDYFTASGALSREGFFREVTTLAELRKRLNAAAPFLPVGTVVQTERVYRMSRGYEPDKPRSGSVDREERLVLVAHGSFYDPKTGKPKPPKWRRVERDRDPGFPPRPDERRREEVARFYEREGSREKERKHEEEKARERAFLKRWREKRAARQTKRDPHRPIKHGVAHEGASGRPDAIAMIRHVPKGHGVVAYYKAERSGRWVGTYSGTTPETFYYVHLDTDPSGFWKPIDRKKIPHAAYVRMREQIARAPLPAKASRPKRRRLQGWR